MVRWEREAREPGAEGLARLSYGLGVAVDVLLGLEPDPGAAAFRVAAARLSEIAHQLDPAVRWPAVDALLQTVEEMSSTAAAPGRSKPPRPHPKAG